MASFLYVAPNLVDAGVITANELLATTERHRLNLRVGSLDTGVDPLEALSRHGDVAGVVVGMLRGWPGRGHLRLAGTLLRRGIRVWFYWPNETAVERVDAHRLRSYRHLWFAVAANRLARRLQRIRRRADDTPELAADASLAVNRLFDGAEPVPFGPAGGKADAEGNVPGLGLYLRTDYWVHIASGGSYTHTCYVAKELAARTERFVCLTASPYALLDEFGLRQIVMAPHSNRSDENALLGATWHYLPMLRQFIGAERPAFLYERLCLGNFAGAMLSAELGIPYFVEYNGSELSMNRSFGGERYRYEPLLIKAEDAAFRQATVVTVVSEVLKQSLIERHVDPAKILVNPNGVDPEAYAPATPAGKSEVRRELGLTDADRVVGFTGTFGGWHGIDVLAAAIPAICAKAPAARFLLIGDGPNKPMIDEAVARHGLEDRVRRTGRVSQADGAHLLAACDIFVSPHSSHMVDSKFFGSPTKIFEYMAMGGGIVSSDLEQLGQVLSPALRTLAFAASGVRVTNQRAVLCAPGSVDEFCAAVVALVDRPDVCEALGRNARQAVLDEYTWQRHVASVLQFAATLSEDPARRRPAAVLARLATAATEKDEVQNQWNENPIGTQYPTGSRPHSLQWFRDIEAHRYGEYAPWMPDLMEFARHRGDEVLEIGGGVGTDLCQFAAHGARVTDLDLSAGHLALARENFALRGLSGTFLHHDAETLPFDDDHFDLVYSNGVLHHTPGTHRAVEEIYRVLKPGGKVIVMMYAENSLHYWYQLVWGLGARHEHLARYSMGEIMSRFVEISTNDARPLVKTYTARQLRALFAAFERPQIYKRQLTRGELPPGLGWLPLPLVERLAGWNLVIKARTPLQPRHS